MGLTYIFLVSVVLTIIILTNNTTNYMAQLLQQEDIRSYIDDSIKNGVPLSAFRKERTSGNSHGVHYWYYTNLLIDLFFSY